MTWMMSVLMPWWRIIVSGVVVSVFVGSCVVRDRKIEKRGADKVLAAGKSAGTKANAENLDVRRRASQPGSFGRLLEESCRDCDP
ncbi:MAG: hypothetical protein IPG25_15380 [Proteobacteria bacterium]|jgi:hypothetical protein|nr:hypothetical protein [Pseudomonadota bacterium]